MKKHKICIVTGSRAEYGLLSCLMERLRKDRVLNLQTIVTGSHLSRTYGNTWQAIRRDGFPITRKIAILSRDNSAKGVTFALSKAISGFAKAFQILKPDLLVVLGDRYEILGAASAALIAKIPIAHIAGGDLTEGAFDDAIRHAITKMSHLHFPTNTFSALRVRQMGENPKHIFNTGHLGIDYIKKLKKFSQRTVEQKLGIRLREKNILVTFHPVTLGDIPSDVQFSALLQALARLGPSVGIIFTRPNADTGGSSLSAAIDRFAKGRANVKVFASLGQDLYLNTMRYVDAVVGNSSSGIYEAPSFRKPTVNIGDRQKGRIQAGSVINCASEATAIHAAIRRAFKKDCSNVKSPYGDGKAAIRIHRIIKSIRTPAALLKKHFYDWGRA